MPPPREEPQTYWEYAGWPELHRRAVEAGCRTVKEVCEWIEEHYGRDQNRSLKPPPYRRPAKP